MPDSPAYIVLTTFDGAAFLPQMLASLRAQTHRDWILLARDDHSSDATRQILRDAAAADSRILLIEDEKSRLGAAGSFGRLLQEALRRDARRVLLADQDDVWHPDKISRQIEALRAAEATGGTSPRLVFCDAAVIDAQGGALHASFLRQNRLPYQTDRPLATLLGRCFVLGCTCAINRALLELALPLPESIASHDWWLALCAAAAGEIVCIDVPLLNYRRHTANASQPAIWDMLRGGARWRQRWTIGWRHFKRSLDQARALNERMREHGVRPNEQADTLKSFCRIIDNPSRWRRLRQMHQLGVPAIGGLRQMLYHLCLLIK